MTEEDIYEFYGLKVRQLLPKEPTDEEIREGARQMWNKAFNYIAITTTYDNALAIEESEDKVVFVEAYNLGFRG